MTLFSQFFKAVAISLKAHIKQRDKGGNMYVFHPIRVAYNCDTIKEKIVALLHDTIEDTSITKSYLHKYFDKEIVEAVVAMSRVEGESYFDFVERCKKDTLARKVKIRDLEDNMNLKRLKIVTGKDLERLEKYKKAKAFLISNSNSF